MLLPLLAQLEANNADAEEGTGTGKANAHAGSVSGNDRNEGTGTGSGTSNDNELGAEVLRSGIVEKKVEVLVAESWSCECDEGLCLHNDDMFAAATQVPSTFIIMHALSIHA